MWLHMYNRISKALLSHDFQSLIDWLIEISKTARVNVLLVFKRTYSVDIHLQESCMLQEPVEMKTFLVGERGLAVYQKMLTTFHWSTQNMFQSKIV